MARRQIHELSYTAAEIDDILRRADEHPFVLYHDKDKGYYRIFANENTKNLWLEDPVANKELELYNFIAPAPYTMYVEALSDTTKYFLKGSDDITVNYSYITRNSSDIEKPEGVDVTYEFNRDGNVTTRTVGYSKPGEISYNISEFVSTAGTYFITITVVGRTTGASAHISFEYHIVDLEIESTFNPAYKYNQGETITIPYESRGPIGTVIEVYIDNKLVAEHATAQNPESDTLSIANNLDSGKHSMMIYGHISTDSGDDFYSNSFYCEFVVKGESNCQYICISLPMGDTREIFADGSNLILSGERYIPTNIKWAYYGSPRQTTTIQWKLNGEDVKVANGNSSDTSVYTLDFMPSVSGDYVLEAYDGSNKIGSYNMHIDENSKGIVESTRNMNLKLSARGRDNKETNPAIWSSGDIQTTFNNFSWTRTQGWDNSALYISRGANIEINHAPFANKPENNGMTFEIEFEVTDIKNEDAVLMNLGGTGNLNITITGNKASFSIGTTSINTQYPQNERIKLAFVLNSMSSKTDTRLMYIINNSIPDRVVQYSTIGSGLSNNDTIKIGDPNGEASIKIYNIRCYDRAISFDEEFYNFIIDNNIVAKKMEENDIYTEGTSIVSVEKMKAKLPVMLITGDIDQLLASTSKDTKVNMERVEFFNCDDSSKNFVITGPRMKLQGTSSLTYPRKNFKLYAAKGLSPIMYDAAGNVIEYGLYAFKDGDIPVDTWTLKADFSDSSCTHNATVARLYGDIEPKAGIRTEPQKIAKDLGVKFPYHQDNKPDNEPSLRTTPNAMPMVMFYRPTDKDEYIFMGQYTMLNDKSNEYVFGFRSIYDYTDPKTGLMDPFLFSMSKSEKDAWKAANPDKTLFDNKDCHCYEILNNSGDEYGMYSLFKTNENFYEKYVDDSGVEHCLWERAFESRYPEKDEDNDQIQEGKEKGAPMYAFIAWVKSLLNTDGTLNQEKFEREAKDHLDLEKCAAYYSYFMRFGAVDQVQKNMMWTTYGSRSGVPAPSNGIEWSAENGEAERAAWDLIWYPIRYDNDTILGVTNTGQLRYDYKIDRQTLDTAAGVDTYAYAGHDSLLWNVLEASEDFMKKLVPNVDEELSKAGINYKNTVHYFDDLVSNRWCERVYTLNEKYKYISPLIDGVRDQAGNINHISGYLTFMQGKRQSHRHWWISNRFDRYDAMWATGEYKNKEIVILAATPGATADDNGELTGGDSHPFTLRFKTAVPFYYGWALDKNIIESNIFRDPNDENEGWYEVTRESSVIGSPIHIYGCNQMDTIDLSDATPYLQNRVTITLNSATDYKLKRLIVGNIDKPNTSANLGITGYKNITTLEEIDFSGMQGDGFTYDSLEELYNLKIFKAKRSNIASFEPAQGSNFDRIELPGTIMSIKLNECLWDEFDYDYSDSLQLVEFINVKEPKAFQFLVNWCKFLNGQADVSTKRIEATGVDWKGIDSADIIALKNKFGDNLNLQGGITLKPASDEAGNKQIVKNIEAAFGDNAFDINSTLHFYIEDYISINIDDVIYEGTSHELSITNYSQMKEGDVKFIINTTGSDTFIDNILTLPITGRDREYTITAIYTSVGGEEKRVTKIVKISGNKYPTNITIVGVTEDPNELTASAGSKLYKYIIADGELRGGKVVSVDWTFDSSDPIENYIASSVDNSDLENSTCTLSITNVPENDVNMTLRVKVTYDNGLSLSNMYGIVIRAYTWPKECHIIGRIPIIHEREIRDENGEIIPYEYFADFGSEQYTGVGTGSWTIDYPSGSDFQNIGTINADTDGFGRPRLTITLSNITRYNNPVSIKYELYDENGVLRCDSEPCYIAIQESDPVVTSDSNPVIMRDIYGAGFSILHNRVYEDELSLVTNERFAEALGDGRFTGLYLGEEDNPQNPKRESFSFDEFKYFTNVNEIPSGAWWSCTPINGSVAVANKCLITSITLPDSVKEIPSNCFQGCFQLKEITIPKSVTSIGSNAFYSCNNLKEILVLNPTAPSFRTDTFGRISSNGKLNIPVDATGYDKWISALPSEWQINPIY